MYYINICKTKVEQTYIWVDVVEWSRALDVRLSEWCCSVSMVWVKIPSREEHNLTALKYNSNTVWFYISDVYISGMSSPAVHPLRKGCTRLAAARKKVYQLLAHGRWFSPGTPASSTTKTGRHDIAEILLKVALKHLRRCGTNLSL